MFILALPADRTNPSHSLELAEERKPTLKPGCLVVFALSTKAIGQQLENAAAIEVTRSFQPKKYLGLIKRAFMSTTEWDDIPHEYVQICPVATCPPREDYISRWRNEEPEKMALRMSQLISLGDAAKVADETDLRLQFVPSLPWQNCTAYLTLMGKRLGVAKVHESDRRTTLSPTDAERLLSISWESNRTLNDFDLVLLGRCEEEAARAAAANAIERGADNWGLAGSDPAETASPRAWSFVSYWSSDEASLRSDETEGDHCVPDYEEVVEIWEDLAELDDVPYPGDFEVEMEELEELIQKCYERMPRQTLLADWVERAQEATSMIEESEPLDVLDDLDLAAQHENDDHSLGTDALLGDGDDEYPATPSEEVFADDDQYEASVSLDADGVHNAPYRVLLLGADAVSAGDDEDTATSETFQPDGRDEEEKAAPVEEELPSKTEEEGRRQHRSKARKLSLAVLRSAGRLRHRFASRLHKLFRVLTCQPESAKRE